MRVSVTYLTMYHLSCLYIGLWWQTKYIYTGDQKKEWTFSYRNRFGIHAPQCITLYYNKIKHMVRDGCVGIPNLSNQIITLLCAVASNHITGIAACHCKMCYSYVLHHQNNNKRKYSATKWVVLSEAHQNIRIKLFVGWCTIGQSHQIGPQYGIKNKAAITLQGKFNGKIDSCLVPYSAL